MTALKPCRFCGETEHLRVHDGYFCDDDQFVWNDDLTPVRGPTGEPTYQDDDAIECLICSVLAPRTMWQADAGTMAQIRIRTREAWAEYDDNGVWRGRGTAVPITPTTDHREARASA